MNSSLTRKSLLCNNALNAWISPCIKSIKNVFLLFLLSLTFSNVFSQTAPVLIPTGGFAIDGNLKSNLTVVGVGDWVQGPAGGGGFVLNNDGSSVDASKTFNTFDPFNSGSDIIFTEGSKGNANPNTKWAWSQSSAPDKNDINRALIHLGRDVNDNVWLAMAGDRLSTNGTAYIDFELLQNTLTRNTANNGFTSAGPDSGRTVNDLLITIEYNNGGGVSDVVFYRWQAVGSSFDYVEIPAPGPSGFAVTNAGAVDVPFGAFGSSAYSALQFVEAAVNVSQVINVGTENACQGLNIKTVVIKTKASSSPSAALKDLVEPLQVSFNIGAVSLEDVAALCSTSSAVTLVGSPVGGLYSGPGVTGNSFNPAAAGPGDHEIIYSKELRPGCTKSDTIIIHVDAAANAGTVTGGGSFCSGASGSVSVTGKIGTVVRWEIMPQGGSWSTVANSAGQTSINYTNLTTTTSYRVVVKNGVCPEVTSDAATVTITAASVAGTVTGGGTLCSGANGSVSVTGKTGDVVRWESMPQGGSWSTVANSAGQISINYTNLTATTSYRVVVKNGVCPEVTSDAATITITAPSNAGSVTGGGTFCSGASGSVSVTGKTGDVVRWESMPQSGSWSAVANSAGQTSVSYTNLTTTTSYRVVVKNGVCPEATSSAATITITAPSNAGSVTGGGTFCSGASGSVSVTGKTGDVVRWEIMPQGGSWSTVANSAGQTSISYTNLTTTTSYRVVVKNGVCPEATSAAATITITATSVAGNVTGATSVCSNTNSGSLSVTGKTGDVVRWEKMPQGGSWSTIAGSAGQTSVSYTNLTVTTSYRVVVKNGVCPEVTSAAATITVTPPAVGGKVTGLGIVCDNNTGGTLTLTGHSGTVVRWESTIDGQIWTPIANTTTSLTYGVLTQRTTFRAVVQQGSCATVNSDPFTVIIISCGPAGNHCTYTQGFYGNVGGLGCSGGNPDGNTMENAQFKMTKAFEFIGQTKVVFGRADINGNSGQDRAFTLFKEDITNGNIFKMLPGGGTATTLGVKAGGTAYGDSYEGATFAAIATWDAVPVDTKKGTNYGRIRNTLLAQTVALFFNMNNGTNLSGFALHDTLYVRNFDCLSGDAIETAPILQFGLPHNVIEYINAHGGTYTKDIAGLYKLANDVLGGLNVSNSFGNDVANAVDKINNAFDGCRSMVGFYDIPALAIGSNRSAFNALGAVTVTEKKTGTLNVSAYPNPYTDKVNFSITSPVSGIGTMEVYNMIGQKVATIYKGHLFAGVPVKMNYNFLSSNSSNLVYILKVGSYKVSGKLTKL